MSLTLPARLHSTQSRQMSEPTQRAQLGLQIDYYSVGKDIGHLSIAAAGLQDEEALERVLIFQHKSLRLMVDAVSGCAQKRIGTGAEKDPSEKCIACPSKSSGIAEMRDVAHRLHKTGCVATHRVDHTVAQVCTARPRTAVHMPACTLRHEHRNVHYKTECWTSALCRVPHVGAHPFKCLCV